VAVVTRVDIERKGETEKEGGGEAEKEDRL